jgi:FkbM family methyltransferase
LSDGADLKSQRYLEIGGNHPFATSATYLLSKRLGMKGVIVEANGKLIANLKKHRSDDIVVHGAVQTEDVETVALSVSKFDEISSLDKKFVTIWQGGSVDDVPVVEVPALRLNQVVREFLNDKAPCFLSIDVEGLDFSLLQDFDFGRYRPWFVQIEPADYYISGVTSRMIEHMRSVNYALIAKTEANLIFKDDFGD